VADVTLLFPCFDEAARVPRLVAAALAWAREHPALDVEVLFVDDGSRDGTAEALGRAGGDRVRVVRLARNRGKGAALRAGVREARGELVVLLDADLAVSVGEVDQVLAPLADGVDVVVGSRNLRESAVVRPQRWPRRGLGRAYLLLARRWLGLRVSDVTCGFKAFRRDTGRRLYAGTRAARWGIDAEVLARAEAEGLVVREVPVRWSDGGSSAVRVARDVAGSLVELLRTRAPRRSGR
jgi:glycosyltransferase involved in cell wall biosynthesis